MENLKVIDISTGEVIQELKEGDRIVKKRSADYLDSHLQVNNDMEFIKLYMTAVDMLAQECDLSKQALTLCLRLLKYIRYDSGIIAYSNGVAMTREHMMTEFGLQERTLDRAIEDLTTNKIIAKVRSGKEINYLVNPYIFMKGTKINKTLHEIFKKSKWYVPGMFNN